MDQFTEKYYKSKINKVLLGIAIFLVVLCFLVLVAFFFGQEKLSKSPNGYSAQVCYNIYWHGKRFEDETMNVGWDLRWGPPNTFGGTPNPNPIHGCFYAPWLSQTPEIGFWAKWLFPH